MQSLNSLKLLYAIKSRIKVVDDDDDPSAAADGKEPLSIVITGSTSSLMMKNTSNFWVPEIAHLLSLCLCCLSLLQDHVKFLPGTPFLTQTSLKTILPNIARMHAFKFSHESFVPSFVDQ